MAYIRSLQVSAARSRTVVLAGLALAVCAQDAAAQPMRTAPAWTSEGYGGAAAVTTTPFQLSGGYENTTVVNGDVQTSGASSLSAQFEALSGGASVSIGAGSSTATAVGNSLNISINGSGNTVVVTNQQSNTAAISAATN